MTDFATYLFVHVPKTAGTSFRIAAEGLFPGKVAYDYGPRADATSPMVRELVHEKKDYEALREWLATEQIVMLGGHVSYGRYRRIFPVERVITFLRDPVARLVSEHHHVRRLYGYSKSFLEFAAERRNRDLQSTVLRGAPLAKVAFFGITERYAQSLDLLEKRLGWTLPCLERNRNPDQPDLGGSYELPPDVLDAVRDTNRADLSFYEGARQLFDAQCNCPDGRLSPSDEAALQIAEPLGLTTAPADEGRPQRGALGRYEAGKLKGWAFIVGVAEPASVRVTVDGVEVAVVVADQMRPDLKAKGLHPTGRAGFAVEVGELAPGSTVRCFLEPSGVELVRSPLVVPARRGARP